MAGWGLDENGWFRNQLKMVKMTVVSQYICIKSDINFYPIFTHETTFCAGIRNGMFMFRQ